MQVKSSDPSSPCLAIGAFTPFSGKNVFFDSQPHLGYVWGPLARAIPEQIAAETTNRPRLLPLGNSNHELTSSIGQFQTFLANRLGVNPREPIGDVVGKELRPRPFGWIPSC